MEAVGRHRKKGPVKVKSKALSTAAAAEEAVLARDDGGQFVLLSRQALDGRRLYLLDAPLTYTGNKPRPGIVLVWQLDSSGAPTKDEPLELPSTYSDVALRVQPSGAPSPEGGSGGGAPQPTAPGAPSGGAGPGQRQVKGQVVVSVILCELAVGPPELIDNEVYGPLVHQSSFALCFAPGMAISLVTAIHRGGEGGIQLSPGYGWPPGYTAGDLSINSADAFYPCFYPYSPYTDYTGAGIAWFVGYGGAAVTGTWSATRWLPCPS